MPIFILRLGHRLHRDDRISTHCGLVARAFGADGIIYSGDKDDSLLSSVKKVVNNWGGSFIVIYEKNWKKVVNEWKKKGKVVLLTMYGINLPDKIEETRGENNLLIVIGSEKVPSEIYDLVDYQVAVTSQPHSEVAALAVFLDHYFGGKELKKEFSNGKMKIIPSEKGKIQSKKHFLSGITVIFTRSLYDNFKMD